MGSGEDSPHSSIWTTLEHIREELKAFFWFIGVDKGQNIESCRAMFTEEEDARCEGAWREEGGQLSFINMDKGESSGAYIRSEYKVFLAT